MVALSSKNFQDFPADNAKKVKFHIPVDSQTMNHSTPRPNIYMVWICRQLACTSKKMMRPTYQIQTHKILLSLSISRLFFTLVRK